MNELCQPFTNAKEGKTEAEEKAAAATEAVKGMMKDVVKDVRDAFNKDKK